VQQENLPWEQLENGSRNSRWSKARKANCWREGLHIYGTRATSIAKPFAHAEQSDALRRKLWERTRRGGQFRARAKLDFIWGSVLEHERVSICRPPKLFQVGLPILPAIAPVEFYPTELERRPPPRSTGIRDVKEARGSGTEECFARRAFLKTLAAVIAIGVSSS